ncbi:MAG: Lrp/AsnC family transcriptional regulator [Candidatus Sumerlaeia bacterium]|nr:Lrp/AsnC family transcriptional regulator [Candidatus Sumerlaeia bacterium]
MKKLNEKEKALLRHLQDTIPVVERPFALLAEKVGITEEEVISLIKYWLAEGIIRRFGAIVRHYCTGKEANALSLWAVEDEKVVELAQALSRRKEVSHCYERECPEPWRYKIFAMIHGANVEECKQVAREVANETGVMDYQLVFTLKEFKKTSLQIF